MGVLIGENDMYTDFGMILTDLSLEMPEVKTKYQELPLENGSIDLSEVVTGRPVYGLRTLKLTFKRRGASASEWLSVCSQIASAVHGKRPPITLPDDLDHYLGRIACAPGAKEYGAGTFEITAVCDPQIRADRDSFVRRGTTAVLNSGDEIVSPDLHGIGGRHDGGAQRRRSIQHRAGGKGCKNPRIVAFARCE